MFEENIQFIVCIRFRFLFYVLGLHLGNVDRTIRPTCQILQYRFALQFQLRAVRYDQDDQNHISHDLAATKVDNMGREVSRLVAEM